MITNHASFLQKKHQDTYAHNFTTQFTELTYRFKDLLPNCIIYNNETKWNQQTCIMKSIIESVHQYQNW